MTAKNESTMHSRGWTAAVPVLPSLPLPLPARVLSVYCYPTMIENRRISSAVSCTRAAKKRDSNAKHAAFVSFFFPGRAIEARYPARKRKHTKREREREDRSIDRRFSIFKSDGERLSTDHPGSLLPFQTYLPRKKRSTGLVARGIPKVLPCREIRRGESDRGPPINLN